MHKALEIDDGGGDWTGDDIVGDVENSESTQSTDIGRKLAGDFVSNDVEDPEIGERSDALRNLASDAFPVGDDEGGEAVESSDGRGD